VASWPKNFFFPTVGNKSADPFRTLDFVVRLNFLGVSGVGGGDFSPPSILYGDLWFFCFCGYLFCSPFHFFGGGVARRSGGGKMAGGGSCGGGDSCFFGCWDGGGFVGVRPWGFLFWGGWT